MLKIFNGNGIVGDAIKSCHLHVQEQVNEIRTILQVTKLEMNRMTRRLEQQSFALPGLAILKKIYNYPTYHPKFMIVL